MDERSRCSLPLPLVLTVAALAILTLCPAPAAASNGGCCIYNGMCTTTTLGQCKKVAGAGGFGYIFNLNQICSANSCKAGSSCFTCRGGALADQSCEVSDDCGDAGLCVGMVEDADATDVAILDALSPVDTDQDGVTDFLDNCAYSANPDQADSDKDGFGDRCPVRPYILIGLPAERRNLPVLPTGARPRPR